MEAEPPDWGGLRPGRSGESGTGAKGRQQTRRGAARWSSGREAAGVAERSAGEEAARSGRCRRWMRTWSVRGGAGAVHPRRCGARCGHVPSGAVRAPGAGTVHPGRCPRRVQAQSAQGVVSAGCPKEEQRGGRKPGLLHSVQENRPDPGAKWRRRQGIGSEGPR